MSFQLLRRSLVPSACITVTATFVALSLAADRPAKRAVDAEPLPGESPGIARIIAAHGEPTSDQERARTPLPADPARIVHFVRPQETDPGIKIFLKDHIATFHRDAKPKGQLLIFFPGTFGRPANQQWLLDVAAGAGYMVLGLEYPNATTEGGASSVKDLTAADPDPNAAEQIRLERITGQDSSPSVKVSPADSIYNRIDKALAFLVKTYPTEGWDAFLKDGKVNWEKVAVGGHSQGAGMAAFLAKRHAVARVCLFSGGIDFHPPTKQFAPWVRKPSATPADRWYGMAHPKEQSYRAFMGGFAIYGMTSTQEPANVLPDGSLPETSAHVLIVTAEPKSGARSAERDVYHSSVVADVGTPFDADNRPIYAEGWRYVLGGSSD